MRFVVLIVATIFGIFRSSSAQLVDASERTTVEVTANAWDLRTGGSGCSPDGCVPENSRDDNLDANSRWSCSESLGYGPCSICYTFHVPQDIERTRLAFWQGDERVRTVKIDYYSNTGDTTETFYSSGRTEDYEGLIIFKDETTQVCLEPVNLGSTEWISLLEVKFMVK